MPAPASSAEPIPSTFTRRPVQKTEADIQEEERILAKKMQAELEKDTAIAVPEVNLLHEAIDPPRTESTYVQKKLAGEPVGTTSMFSSSQPKPAPSQTHSNILQDNTHTVSRLDGGFNKSVLPALDGSPSKDEFGLNEINSLLGLTKKPQGGGLAGGLHEPSMGSDAGIMKGPSSLPAQSKFDYSMGMGMDSQLGGGQSMTDSESAMNRLVY